jgi:hypothetical protein
LGGVPKKQNFRENKTSVEHKRLPGLWACVNKVRAKTRRHEDTKTRRHEDTKSVSGAEKKNR